LLLVNSNGTVVEANRAARLGLQTEGTSLVGRGVLDLLPELDPTLIPGSMRPRPAGDDSIAQEPVRMSVRRTDGSTFPAEVSANDFEGEPGAYDAGYDPYGSASRYGGSSARPEPLLLIVVRDLTERLETEAELRRQHKQTEMILRAAAEGVVGVDTEGRVVLVNPAAAHILGYRASELGGQELRPLVLHSRADGSPIPDEESALIDTLASGRKHRIRRTVLWRKDGRSVPVEMSTAPVRDGEQLVGAVMTFSDLTSQLALKARHEHLTAVLEEELRGPLASVQSKLGTLANDPAGQLWPEANWLLHTLTAECARFARLVDGVLAHQRFDAAADAGKEALELETVPLEKVLGRAVEIATELSGPGRIRFVVHPSSAELCADTERLAQALGHLIVDAALARDASGAVVEASGVDVVVAAAQRGDVVRVEVRGPGEGGKVHLPITRGTVERHGGVLQTHRTPGPDGAPGVTFVVELPMDADAAAAAQHRTGAAARAQATRSREHETAVLPELPAGVSGPDGGAGPQGPGQQGPGQQGAGPARPGGGGRRRGPSGDGPGPEGGRDGDGGPQDGGGPGPGGPGGGPGGGGRGPRRGGPGDGGTGGGGAEVRPDGSSGPIALGPAHSGPATAPATAPAPGPGTSGGSGRRRAAPAESAVGAELALPGQTDAAQEVDRSQRRSLPPPEVVRPPRHSGHRRAEPPEEAAPAPDPLAGLLDRPAYPGLEQSLAAAQHLAPVAGSPNGPTGPGGQSGPGARPSSPSAPAGSAPAAPAAPSNGSGRRRRLAVPPALESAQASASVPPQRRGAGPLELSAAPPRGPQHGHGAEESDEAEEIPETATETAPAPTDPQQPQAQQQPDRQQQPGRARHRNHGTSERAEGGPIALALPAGPASPAPPASPATSTVPVPLGALPDGARTGEQSPARPAEPAEFTGPRRLLVWPQPDPSTRQALVERGYEPVTVRSRDEVDAQSAHGAGAASHPAALFVDPLTGPITRTALQSLRTAAISAHVPVLVTAGLGQATREAAYGADPAVLLRALAPRDSEQHAPRVLLVEQDADIAAAFTATLERRGMQVAHAASESDAVTRAGQLQPNLVVIDLMLVRRRRVGIIDWLRSTDRLHRTPIVVYTSVDIDAQELPRLRAGETVLFLAERSTNPEVQGRIVDLLGKIGSLA